MMGIGCRFRRCDDGRRLLAFAGGLCGSGMATWPRTQSNELNLVDLSSTETPA